MPQQAHKIAPEVFVLNPELGSVLNQPCLSVCVALVNTVGVREVQRAALGSGFGELVLKFRDEGVAGGWLGRGLGG